MHFNRLNQGVNMKKIITVLLAVCVIILIASAIASADDLTSIAKGKWNSPSVWSGGAVPTASDNVTITLADTVTFDTTNALDTARTFECNNLTITGMLKLSQSFPYHLTVHGNLVVQSTGRFAMNTNKISGGGDLIHTITLYGDLSNSGTFDMKTGTTSSPPHTLCITDFEFVGPNNTTINLVGGYTSVNNEFGAITINKSDGAKVILASDITFPSGSSSVTTPGGNPVITFKHGVIETGPFSVIHLWTSSSAVVGASDTTGYVLGNLGRGIANTPTASLRYSRTFDIGDVNGYRPFRSRATDVGNVTGHYLTVGIVDSNANTGTSSFSGFIDKVSSVRYYKVTWHYGVLGVPPDLGFDRFAPSYGREDGVAAGNTHLKVGFSQDSRVTWINLGAPSHTTALDTLPRNIYSDTATIYTLHDGIPVYVALARDSGTTENTLDFTVSSVKSLPELPGTFTLAQNFPNPFNPSTTIEYRLATPSFVTLSVFNILGEKVSTLVSGRESAGVHSVVFGAAGLPSGVYLCRIDAGSFSEIKRMLLVR
jgi:hypothetical protein